MRIFTTCALGNSASKARCYAHFLCVCVYARNSPSAIAFNLILLLSTSAFYIDAFNKSSAFNRFAFERVCVCVCVCVCVSTYLSEIIQRPYAASTHGKWKQAQPEKNVITDLADFICLINHRLVVFLTAACRCQHSYCCFFCYCCCCRYCPPPVGDDFFALLHPKCALIWY